MQGWLGGFLVILITLLVILIVRELLQRKNSNSSGFHELDNVEKRDLTLEQLSEYDGSSRNTAIYVCARGIIYDVSKASKLYGPEGVYSILAGHDASYCLGKSSLKDCDLNKPIDSLTDVEIDRLNEWKRLYDKKYPVVGKLVN